MFYQNTSRLYLLRDSLLALLRFILLFTILGILYLICQAEAPTYTAVTVTLKSDGYHYESQTFIPNRTVKLKFYQSKEEMQASVPFGTFEIPEGKELRAYSSFKNGICTIHIVDPKVLYEPEYLGHELYHCISVPAQFHGSQK